MNVYRQNPEQERPLVGDSAVLRRLAALGYRARTYENMIAAGFPPWQISAAMLGYIGRAQSITERYSAAQMKKGIFDDDALLDIFETDYNCLKANLLASAWFCSDADYDLFYEEICRPFRHAANRLIHNNPLPDWKRLFRSYTPANACQVIVESVWLEVSLRNHPWEKRRNYAYHCMRNMFHYVYPKIKINSLFKDFRNLYIYEWERILYTELNRNIANLTEQILLKYSDDSIGKERLQGFQRGFIIGTNIGEALQYFDLNIEKITAEKLKKAFRKKSLIAHPDRGGTKEDFHQLKLYKQTLDNYLLDTKANNT